MGKKYNRFKEKARAAVENAKDYINNNLENDAQKATDQTVKAAKTAAEQAQRYNDKHLVDNLHSVGAVISKAAEQAERYADKHLVNDLHSAGEAINKAAEQIKNVAHCVELCSSGSEVIAKDSCMNDNADA